MARKSAEPLPSRVMTTQQACERLDISRQMLWQVAKAGYISQLGENRWDEAEVTLGYIKFLRASRSEKSEAETRVRDAKLIGEQLKNIERMGRVTPVEDYDDFTEGMAGIWLTELGSLPARHHQRDLQERRRLERDCNGILERVSNYCKLAAARAPATRKVATAFNRGDAGRMGRAQ